MKRAISKRRRKPVNRNVIVDLELCLTNHIIQHFAFRDERPLSLWEGFDDVLRVASRAALYLPEHRGGLYIGTASWLDTDGGELSFSVSATGNYPFLNVKIACPFEALSRLMPESYVRHVIYISRVPVHAAGYVPSDELRPRRGTVRDKYPKKLEHIDLRRRLQLERRLEVQTMNAARAVAGLPARGGA